MMKRSTVLVFLLSVIMGGALYHVKFKVEEIEGRLAKTMKAIALEEENLHILKAEWSYLNEPQRLQSLAEKHLDLKLTGIEQYLLAAESDMLDSESPIKLASFVR